MTISATTQGLRPGVCTSSNRPATPFEGQMIYETDTDLTYIYGGSAWQQVSGGTAVGNSGLVYIATATATSGTTLNITSCFSSTYNDYRVIISNYLPTSGAAVTVQLGTGTALASGYYWAGVYVSAYTASPTVTGYGGANVNQYETHLVGDGTNAGGGNLEIYSPNLATRTAIMTQSMDARTGGNPRIAITGFQNTNTQFTSLHLTSGATISTLTATVYGYRKA